MALTEEEKKELEQPQMTLADFYNADTPEGASMRSLYDLKDNTLVLKETPNNDQVELNAIVEPLNQEAKSYGEMIDQWKKDRDEYEAESNKRVERMEKASQWGSIVEAASALTNLIGTTKGATSMQIPTHSQAWRNEADALRRERDSKMENYRSQMSTLKKMKQDIEMKKASVVSAYNAQKETTARQNARLAANLETVLAREEAKANTQFAKNGESARRNITSNARAFLQAMISQYGYQGILPTPEKMEQWAASAYKIALEHYKQTNPGDFDGSGVPSGDIDFDTF